jgi:hypothetical protein
MSALRYIPGQIVVFGTSPLQENFDETSISAFGELLISNTYGPYYLELLTVNRGEELRILDYVRSRPGVIATSLNYIGFGLSERYIDEENSPESSYPPGIPPERNIKYFINDPKTNSINDKCTFDDLLEEIKRIDNTNLVVAIDVEPNHCCNMMQLIIEGINYSQNKESLGKSITVIGLTSDIETGGMTDLFGFKDRVLTLIKIKDSFGIKNEENKSSFLSINMSVDFAQMIPGYSDMGDAEKESPDTVLSIPLFEEVLRSVVSDLTNEFCSPAVLAAAGNRLIEGNARVRLGYPAMRPEVMATSFVDSSIEDEDYVQPLKDVDIPATTGLKPCFVVNAKQMALSKYGGSSYASAWLAGYCAMLTLDQKSNVNNRGMFSKVAWLLQKSERRRLPSGKYRLPCFVAMIREETNPTTPQLEAEEKTTLWDTNELIHALNTEFNADFCLYGSTSAVGEWLRLNKRHLSDMKPWIQKDIGDVDIMYAGFIKDNDVSAVKEFARDWLRKQLKRSWVVESKRLVQVHSYEGAISFGERLRSVTPVNKLYITQGGVIDTWGGVSDLEKRNIRFYPMTHPSFWASNNQYNLGSDCLGLNILQWISIITLLQLVSHSIEVEPPRADPDSLKRVQEILTLFENGELGFKMFGRQRNDIRERVERRWGRVEILMGSCARHKIVDTELDECLQRLITLRDKTSN